MSEDAAAVSFDTVPLRSLALEVETSDRQRTQFGQPHRVFWLDKYNAILSFLVPAFITSSAFNKKRIIQAVSPQWPTHTEDAGYCMEFKTESLTAHCALDSRPLTRWMQYLREGYTVCVDCQPPAMNSVSLRCSGDGLDSDGNQTLRWQAIGNPRCQGTWKKVRRAEQCSCPDVHRFIFI